MFKKMLLFSIVFIFSISNVSASEYYYVNDKGVRLTEKEYDFISKMYYEGYQKYLTKEEYKVVFAEEINDDITSNTYIEYGNELHGTSHSSASKSLTISESCSDSCLIIVKASWLKSPTIRSYDLIGAYLDGVSLLNAPITSVVNSTNSTSTVDYDSFANGFGVSAKLISTGNDMQIMQTYRTTRGGHVYASYQHAKKEITLANSKQYTINYAGYGHVFLFNNMFIREYYDGMGGVDIAV